MLGLSCGIWDLIPWSGIEPGPLSLGAWSLSHWTTREVPSDGAYSPLWDTEILSGTLTGKNTLICLFGFSFLNRWLDSPRTPTWWSWTARVWKLTCIDWATVDCSCPMTAAVTPHTWRRRWIGEWLFGLRLLIIVPTFFLSRRV